MKTHPTATQLPKAVFGKFPVSSKLGLILSLVFVAAGSALLAADQAGGADPSSSRPNILFIAADDLRPELGCYGVKQVKTPNIDRLASRGVVFTRAYCQQPLCGPTRASLLTGLRPSLTGVLHNDNHFREKNPAVITLPQCFKNNGYVTMSIGKIFHGGKEDPISWTETLKPKTLEAVQRPGGSGRKAPGKASPAGKKGGGAWNPGPALVCEDVPDQAYADGVTADTAILALREHKDRPFFLAVGFLKPHLSFVAPKKYWDMYDPTQFKLASNPYPPKDCPPIALPPSIELRARTDIPKDGPIPPDLARRLIHGYSACVSYVDAQVGRVLEELERGGLADKTIVVLWGDHGWQLGEHDMWGKASNFETSARAPLIMAAPGRKGNGKKADGLVEFVDIYPTLCELAGLSLPAHLQGKSMASLLDNPARPGKLAAFTQYPCPALREWAGLPLDDYMSITFRPLMGKIEKNIQAMDPDDYSPEKYRQHVTGYSLRTDQYRLVYWCDDRKPAKPIALELYDHAQDPDENVNVAGKAEYAKTVAALCSQLSPNLPGKSHP
jgi:iduronate 2-sulfatase